MTMGTSALTCVLRGSDYLVAQYTPRDGAPADLGARVLDYCARCLTQASARDRAGRMFARRALHVTPAEAFALATGRLHVRRGALVQLSRVTPEEYPSLDTADILSALATTSEAIPVVLRHDAMTDVDWTYAIHLDKGLLVTLRGKQVSPAASDKIGAVPHTAKIVGVTRLDGRSMPSVDMWLRSIAP